MIDYFSNFSLKKFKYVLPFVVTVFVVGIVFLNLFNSQEWNFGFAVNFFGSLFYSLALVSLFFYLIRSVARKDVKGIIFVLFVALIIFLLFFLK